MRTSRRGDDLDGFGAIDSADTRVLTTREERQLLADLGECKRKLAEALKATPEFDGPEDADPQTLAQQIAAFYAADGPAEATLGAIFRRYSELRGKLALANMRLVAHVAKRFRDRGVSYSDLLQEGFCGLLESIDRFDLNHQTKLATYATWWIRQAMQRAVAAGAYPVRLSPRHLRQLAQNQDEVDAAGAAPGHDAPGVSSEMIQRIHTATRPTLSLDANLVPAIPGERPSSGQNPLMLSRFLAGFLHPLIHAGYGAEFGLFGMIAEGLFSNPADLVYTDKCGSHRYRRSSIPSVRSRFALYA